ncbi:MAG: hypothetical protein JM58_02270 [Peptococcaceae bacterium BICA1-8]|nr:MAG: hypothetical protein JM58_02270 [Peptococcaceae bacterium BICA1-8]
MNNKLIIGLTFAFLFILCFTPALVHGTEDTEVSVLDAPEISLISGGEPYLPGSWTNKEVLVSLSVGADSLPGLTCQYKIISEGDWISNDRVWINKEGTTNLYYRTIDEAENASEEKMVEIKLDTSSPEPFSIEVVMGTTQATVSGSTTDDLSGLLPAPYKFYYYPAGWTTYKVESSHTFTGLNPNTLYNTFQMMAVDNLFYSTKSNSLSKYTLAEVPSINLISATDDAISGTIVSNGNPSGTDYYLQYSSDNSFSTEIETLGWSTSTDFTVAHIDSSKRYYFRVKARNKSGVETSWSSKATIPVEPTELQLSADSETAITFSWSNNNNTEDTFYYPQYRKVGATEWLNAVSDTMETYIQVIGLDSNTDYELRVKAGNGDIITTDYSTTITGYTLAYNPLGLETADKDNTSLTFNINNNHENETAPELKIIILLKDGEWPHDIKGFSEFNSVLENRNISGLDLGTEYEGWVITRNGDEVENPAVKMLDSIYTNRLPEVSLSGESGQRYVVGVGQINISWDSSDADGDDLIHTIQVGTTSGLADKFNSIPSGGEEAKSETIDIKSSVDWPVGTYYWRVIVNDGHENVLSEERSFEIIKRSRNTGNSSSFQEQSAQKMNSSKIYKIADNEYTLEQILEVIDPTKEFRVKIDGNFEENQVEIEAELLEILREQDITIILVTNKIRLSLPTAAIPLREVGSTNIIISIKEEAANNENIVGTYYSVIPRANLFTIGIQRKTETGTQQIWNLKKDIVVQINLNHNMLNFLGNQKKLNIYKLNKSSNVWEYVRNRVDLLNKNISFSTSTIGTFRIMEHNKTFADIKGHWSQADVELMASKYFVKEVIDNQFNPDDYISRAEFFSILDHVMDITVEADFLSGISISDVEYGPNDPITRELVAAMLVRILELRGQAVKLKANEPEKLLEYFSDKNNISSWVREDIVKAIKLGIIIGTDVNMLNPQAYASRAQCAVMIWRFIEILNLI